MHVDQNSKKWKNSHQKRTRNERGAQLASVPIFNIRLRFITGNMARVVGGRRKKVNGRDPQTSERK